MRALSGFTVTPAPESGDKLTRFGPFSSQCRAGNVNDPKRLSRGGGSESATWPTESGSSRRQKPLKHGDRQCV